MVVRQAIGIALCFIFSLLNLQAQGVADADTIVLQEVTIQGLPLQRFSVGNKVETIDSASIGEFQGGSLADLLLQRTPLYLKTYGSGMLSTPSFRGTSASHTAVMWHGININSASLGLSDFSIIPVFAMDQVAIHYGGSSSLFGSDAIGGTIDLSSSPAFGQGLRTELRQEIGSFDHYFTSLAVKFGHQKLALKTGVFHRYLENDFPFVNTTRFNSPSERQNNATIRQAGIVQDIYIKTSTRNYISINAWANQSDRQIQPTMTNRQSDDHQKDRNIRTAANYHHHSAWGYSNIRGGYIYDLINFNGSSSTINRLYGAVQHEVDLGSRWNIRIGGDWNHIIADVPGHGRRIKEDRNDVFILSRFSPSDKLQFHLNVRKPMVSGFKTPVAPSLGTAFTFWQQQKRQLTWKASVAKNYRVPTLNDRFWSPGGNPAITPETSINTTTGLVYSKQANHQNHQIELSLYNNVVDDWIIWIPGDTFWSPENLKKVQARGIELSHRLDLQVGVVKVQSTLAYLFSKTTSISSDIPEEKGMQLPYTPLHSGSFHTRMSYKSWTINPALNYTGRRYTTSFQDRDLPAYALVDIRFGKVFQWQEQALHFGLAINNITDKVYQNYEYRAMPGRNFTVSIKYNIN